MKTKSNPLDALSLAIDREIFPLAKDTLFFNADVVSDLDMEQRSQLLCEQGFRPTYLQLESAGMDVSAVLAKTQKGNAAIINCGRVRKVNEANIVRAWNNLSDGALICVVGDKSSGVQPIRKWVSQRTPIVESFSKFHALVFTFVKQGNDWPLADLSHVSDGYQIASGMFSADGPDKGSKVLAEHFDNRLRGKVADIGAGWGYLSDQALKASNRIESVDLYEADWLSLEAAKQNVTSKVPLSINWIDIQTEFKKKPYDWVLMNPPFHAGLGKGRATQPDIGKKFIETAASTLIQGGRLLMVANRTLPYEEILRHVFKRAELLDDKNGYKVYEAVK